MEEKNPIKQTLSEEVPKPKINVWKFIGILAILGLIACIYIILADPFETEEDNIPIESTNLTVNETNIEEFICSQIQVTPTWLTNEGVIGEGFSDFQELGNHTPTDAIDILIDSGIYFVYHSDDIISKNQIGYFGIEWGRYVTSGYTLDCKYV